MFNRHVDGVEEEVAEKFKAQYPELSQAESFDDISAFVNSKFTKQVSLAGFLNRIAAALSQTI